jgi:CRP-like cAMP-binding protein
VNIVATSAGPPRDNLLLGALPDDSWERLRPNLQPIWLPPRQAIYEAGAKLTHVYFPTTALVSSLGVMSDGGSAAIALTGYEGMVGVALLLGSDSMPNWAVVQSAGWAYRIRSALIQKEFGRNGNFRQLLLRYVQARITQVTQTALCNRHHSVDQQLCRWILQSLDRVETNELAMTQDLIATMLGVRREGVTEAAGNLQRAGLLQYQRGRITVQNRAGLEARCCECYEVVRKEFNRLLRTPQRMSGKIRCATVAYYVHTNGSRYSSTEQSRRI